MTVDVDLPGHHGLPVTASRIWGRARRSIKPSTANAAKIDQRGRLIAAERDSEKDLSCFGPGRHQGSVTAPQNSGLSRAGASGNLRPFTLSCPGFYAAHPRFFVPGKESICHTDASWHAGDASLIPRRQRIPARSLRDEIVRRTGNRYRHRRTPEEKEGKAPADEREDVARILKKKPMALLESVVDLAGPEYRRGTGGPASTNSPKRQSGSLEGVKALGSELDGIRPEEELPFIAKKEWMMLFRRRRCGHRAIRETFLIR